MKNAIVTGGTKGIGLAITKMLLAEGYDVTITYAHDEDSANVCREEFVRAGYDVTIIRVDQTQKEEVEQFAHLMKEKSHIDCFVGNAGITSRKKLIDMSDEDWEMVMQANVNSYVYLIRDLYPLFQNNSRLIFIGSMMGIFPHSVSIAYGVTKAAITALAKNLVKIFEGTRTTVNVIAPGFVDTQWHQSKSEEHRNRICEKTALKRFAQPEEIADAVKFCINNAFVNGSVIEVSGGYDFK